MPNWYNPRKTLTHNALYNFIVGERSSGKSYGLKELVVRHYKKTGKQFVYLRRNQNELDAGKGTYFDDIIMNGVFPEDKITFEADCYFLNEQLMGYAHALTKAQDYKSTAFPNVWIIIFEEFIIEENGFKRYLKNEPEIFLGYYMSIDRYRGVKVFFLGNNYTMFNPHLLYWGLNEPYSGHILKKKNGQALLEMVEGMAEERLKTAFGQLVDGTQFADYAIRNKSRIDTKTFVQKKTEKCSYYFTFIYEGTEYGVWVDYMEGKFFVSADVDPFFKMKYSITLDDHNPNTMLLKNINKSVMFKTFIDAYKDGCVYFESMKIKSIVYNVIKMCLGGK